MQTIGVVKPQHKDAVVNTACTFGAKGQSASSVTSDLSAASKTSDVTLISTVSVE